jgi:hypothetical protein
MNLSRIQEASQDGHCGSRARRRRAFIFLLGKEMQACREVPMRPRIRNVSTAYFSAHFSFCETTVELAPDGGLVFGPPPT